MSKLNSKKIKYKENDFLVETPEDVLVQGHLSRQEIVMNRVQDKAEAELENAKQKAAEIVQTAQKEAQEKGDEILANAKEEAEKILANAKKEAEEMITQANQNKDELINHAQEEADKISQEAANKGYSEGYQDAQEKFFEENEEKIKSFDEFCAKQIIVRDKILKNASREIINIIQNISKNILFKELDGKTLENIIKNTISLFDKKEKITIILSEKYAKLLYELQKRENDVEINFDEFNQYQGFEIIYNKELPQDTIIVENPKERFCASIIQQVDKIMREINQNTQNGNIELEEYDETSGLK